MKKINILLVLVIIFSFASIGVLSASGSSAVYQSTKYIPGDFADPWSLFVDKNDNVYHSGSFSSSTPVNFNPDGSDNKISTSNQDGYFTKYNADGSYAWTRTISGPSQDYVLGVTADLNGNVYAVGSFQGSDANFNESGSELHTSNGSTDGFITKYSATGNHIWTIANGGTTLDSINSVVVDTNSDVIVVGNFTGTMDFDPGTGVDSYTSTAASWDTFISKYSSGGTYLWTKVLMGDQLISGSVDVDTSNNIYVAGGFRGTVDFDPTVTTNNIAASGSSDMYVLKLTSSGSVVWLKNTSGAGMDEISSISVVGSQIAISGNFDSVTYNFNPNGTDTMVLDGSSNGFISSWTTDGVYNWTRIYGNDTAQVEAVTMDKDGSLYGSGIYSGTNVNFDPTSSQLRSTEVGEDDMFVVKVSSAGDFAWVKSSQKGDSNWVNGVGVTSNYDVLSFGQLFSDSTGTNMNEDGSDLFGDGSTFDIFLTRWSQTFTQDITNLPSDIEIKDKDGNDIPAEGFEKDKEIEIGLYDKSKNIRVVMLPITLDQDVDWSQVDVGIDTATGKSFAKGLDKVVGPSDKHSLTIPKKAGQNGVIICPFAESLEEVSVDCVSKVIYTEDDPDLSFEIINGNAYWVVAGLSGTGGIGSVVTLQETGAPVFASPIIGISLIALALFVIRYKRSYYKFNGIS